MAVYIPVYSGVVDKSYPNGYERYLIDDEESVRTVMQHYSEHKTVAFDTETSGLNHTRDFLVGFSFSFEEKIGFYVPVRHRAEGSVNLPEEQARMFLGWLSKKFVLMYNAKFDMRFMRNEGINDEEVRYLDIMALVWNMDTNIGNPSLKFAMERLLGWQGIKSFEGVLLDAGYDKKDIKKGIANFSCLSPEQALDYAVFDSIALIRLMVVGGKFYNQNKFIIDLDSAVARELMRIEDEAHPMDIEILEVVASELKEILESLRVQIYKEFGEEFNINSSQQLGKLLWLRGIATGEVTEKTKKMKVNEKCLEEIKDRHPGIPFVIEWKKKKKLHTSYAEKLRSAFSPEKGGCNFNYFNYKVPTGRLASGGGDKGDKPFFAGYNIQSTVKAAPCMFRVERCSSNDRDEILGWKFIPDKDGQIEGESPTLNVRRAFIPLPGCYFVHIDYSGQELRIPANLSGDPGMIQAFLSGEDYHKKIALSLVNGDESLYNKELRRIAKSANFGNLYGGDAKTIADNTGCSMELAEQIFDKWWAAHRILKKWVNQSIRQARTKGFVQTFFGRVRWLSFYYALDDRRMASFADRSAVNTQVQGCAGDMMRIALIRLGKFLKKEADPKFRVLSSVHDEVNFSVPKERLKEYLPGILECMDVTPEGWKVKMEVDFGIGTSWGHQFSFHYNEGDLVPSI